MARPHNHGEPLLRYASQANIVYPKTNVPLVAAEANALLAQAVTDFPSAAVAASATAVQATHADHTAKTRIQTEP